MAAHNLSQADLARRCGTSPAHISRIVSHARQPGFDLCIRLADGLNLSQVLVLRKAELIKEPVIEDESMSEWIELFDKLPELDRHELLIQARFRVAFRKGEGWN